MNICGAMRLKPIRSENWQPGEYSVTVTDANGCIATLKTLVEEYSALECTITILQNETSPGASDGEVLL
jgi:hypothetical protein